MCNKLFEEKSVFFSKDLGVCLFFCEIYQLKPRTSVRKRLFLFNVDVDAFLPSNLVILKADIPKTSLGRYGFLFIFKSGTSICTRIQKKTMKKFPDGVNYVHLALRFFALWAILKTCLNLNCD